MLTIETTLQLSINTRFILSNNRLYIEYFNVVPIIAKCNKIETLH